MMDNQKIATYVNVTTCNSKTKSVNKSQQQNSADKTKKKAACIPTGAASVVLGLVHEELGLVVAHLVGSQHAQLLQRRVDLLVIPRPDVLLLVAHHRLQQTTITAHCT